uniref:Transcription initiation factor TFIID subunit 12 domain-containing protein n=1 Tax=Leptocylindrus danicus TaxID=163516 RepID=A0A7S2NRC7_9STRA|mmetsp:Transcript_10994/g.16601  ORF Transcript_10994/g.16601 Transcript_10994/m.16601 type:complete len:307 (+) Transcript_10994:119-1039(+)|eukprot:CAMPEP_0116029560 /NCGR_PEP_ID=MMETSP0321-20121206/16212_1 /TAXON_ID=163516 /ORGANISM="Leptocylindrus danicus var. danicus, Strain B650" /LENGTH=306 /DNA_ID=CAMNT_0003503959 /DNA_START=107 /DNA_END=1027 /DNA_ORIENTATION=+
MADKGGKGKSLELMQKRMQAAAAQGGAPQQQQQQQPPPMVVQQPPQMPQPPNPMHTMARGGLGTKPMASMMARQQQQHQQLQHHHQQQQSVSAAATVAPLVKGKGKPASFVASAGNTSKGKPGSYTSNYKSPSTSSTKPGDVSSVSAAPAPVAVQRKVSNRRTSTPTDKEAKLAGPLSAPLAGQKVRDLLKTIDSSYTLDPDAEDQILRMADEFVEKLVSQSMRLAKHRNAGKVAVGGSRVGVTLDVADVQLCLSKQWGITVPGLAPRAKPTNSLDWALNAVGGGSSGTSKRKSTSGGSSSKKQAT